MANFKKDGDGFFFVIVVSLIATLIISTLSAVLERI